VLGHRRAPFVVLLVNVASRAVAERTSWSFRSD
jgi:hypothetical protein